MRWRKAGLPCTVFTDGMTVVIDNDTSREPDAAVQCGVATDLDSMILEAPLIVVEVASPSSERDDTGDKLVEYFSVPSIRHYLIVKPVKNVVIHHARNETGDISTRIVTDGEISLDTAGHGGRRAGAARRMRRPAACFARSVHCATLSPSQENPSAPKR